MKAEEARKITHDHSKTMQIVFKEIKNAAEHGYSRTTPTVSLTDAELEVLRNNGYDARRVADDEGQWIEIKW